ncbi:Uncharacterized protein Rs2_21524 [Raphanus sativus]|nr:Uncharacterized protein Rs2_21524 [Raphanus sativus]
MKDQAEALHEEYERGIAAIEAEADDDELWSGEARGNFFSEDSDSRWMFTDRREEMEGIKRKAWMDSADGNIQKFSTIEKGETSEKRYTRRKKNAVIIVEAADEEEKT